MLTSCAGDRRVTPTLSPHILRSTGVVSVQWQKVVRVRAPSRSEAFLEFNEGALAALRIDRQRIAATVDVSGSAAADSVEWTSKRPCRAIGTWSALALLHSSRALRARKMATLFGLLREVDVLVLQEVHGLFASSRPSSPRRSAASRCT